MAEPTLRPFKIYIPDSELNFLKLRLESARWPNLADVTGGKPWGTTYGPPIPWVQQLVKDWKDDFLPKWREHEAELNKFNHSIATIDGLDIHYVHHRADPAEDQSKVIPLLLLHGWPGSFLEFLRTIPLLTSPTSHGLPGPAFHVIIPSLPSFLFSSPYPTAPFPWSRIAPLLNTLVTHPSLLSYPRYAVQGGDWGSVGARIVASMFPKECRAVHLNFLPAGPGGVLGWISETWLMRNAIRYAPGWAIGGEGLRDALRTTLLYVEDQSDYMRVQHTKPIALGYGLDDSPVGLLAWMAEKFGWWSSTPAGQPIISGDDNYDYTSRVNRSPVKTDLLLNASLYWFTRTGASSVLIYKDNTFFEQINDPKNYITQPLAVSTFPQDLSSGAQREDFCKRNGNLKWYKRAERGSHFAAWQDTDIFVEHLQEAFGKIWEY